MTDFEEQCLKALISGEETFPEFLLTVADICQQIANEQEDDAACSSRWDRRAEAVLAVANIAKDIK